MSKKQKKTTNKTIRINFSWFYLLLVGGLFFLLMRDGSKANPQKVEWPAVQQMILDGDVKDVHFVRNDFRGTITIKPERIEKYKDMFGGEVPAKSPHFFFLVSTSFEMENEFAALNAQLDADSQVPVIVEHESRAWSEVLQWIIPLVLLIIMYVWMFRMMSNKMGGGAGGQGGGMNPFNVGKVQNKETDKDKVNVTFKDVAGLYGAKEEVVEIVDFLKNPQKYTALGAKIPKGALLVGPPGTGKTLLAKAVAGEAHAPFFSISGSDFVEMFVGVGASRVRDLFEEAKKSAPCIIFIDEIDAIGKSRDSRYGGGNDEREQTLNQLLAEMDGFDSSKGVLVLAATNRPEVLDSALLRPGRFDRRVIVDKPDLKGREDILRVHAQHVNLDETVDFKEIALATSGAVGSDLANMINEAAILAVKKGRAAVSQKDLFESVEVVLMGKEKKNKILSSKERSIVSYHEVGHALISALQKDSEPVQKITIVPRTMGALGYVMNVPEEEKCLLSKDELWARLVEYVGGRAAEEIVFGSVTTGASNDIEEATQIARSMVTRYGMSEKFGLIGLERASNQYLDDRTVMDCSEVTRAEVDKEVMELLKKAYEEAKGLLNANRTALDKIAAFLIEKETITGKEFMEIFHRVRGEENKAADQAAVSGKEDAADQAVLPEDSAAEDRKTASDSESRMTDV